MELERLAIGVPDLDAWVAKFEVLLGPGFQRSTVEQATGSIEVAIHPAGIELVAMDSSSTPQLRSFHLATDDVEAAVGGAQSVGWAHVNGFDFGGRRHEVLDADGVRMLVLERSSERSRHVESD